MSGRAPPTVRRGQCWLTTRCLSTLPLQAAVPMDLRVEQVKTTTNLTRFVSSISTVHSGSTSLAAVQLHTAARPHQWAKTAARQCDGLGRPPALWPQLLAAGRQIQWISSRIRRGFDSAPHRHPPAMDVLIAKHSNCSEHSNTDDGAVDGLV